MVQIFRALRSKFTLRRPLILESDQVILPSEIGLVP